MSSDPAPKGQRIPETGSETDTRSFQDRREKERERERERERETEAMASMAAAVPFWRAAGMTYITYSNICASLVRGCLKEPYRSEAAAREKVHFAVSKWANGKPEKSCE
ncbi:unnamed protein product [Musa banksii]